MAERPRFGAWLEEIWYGSSPLSWILAPLGVLFCGAVTLRRFAYRSGLLKMQRAAVPVIVVGNITVGGTGKTPLVLWLIEMLRRHGYRPGIVARGHGGNAQHWPQQVRADSDPVTVGDEPVLLAQRGRCPIAVGPNRPAAIDALLAHTDCNIVVSDDGLQHYLMARDVEIAVVDGNRRYGNGRCLPAGPLREPESRLRQVDLLVSNGLPRKGEFPMKIRADRACKLLDPTVQQPLIQFQPRTVHVVAGIAHAERFGAMLRALNFRITAHWFPDHHPFRRADLEFGDDQPVLMTEKDAVKCRYFARDNWWYVPIQAELPEVFERRLMQLLEKSEHG